MARFKILWNGDVFGTAFIDANNKEEAMKKAEKGDMEIENIDEIQDVQIEECNEIF